MTSGERRLAERLEQKLDDDYLIWYDVPVGPKQMHPDFVVLNPRRGLLVLETKDWKLETVLRATRQYWEILPGGIAQEDGDESFVSGPALRDACKGSTRTRSTTGGAAWHSSGKADISMGLRCGVYPHHTQAIHGCGAG
jgi:hypothetical protein